MAATPSDLASKFNASQSCLTSVIKGTGVANIVHTKTGIFFTFLLLTFKETCSDNALELGRWVKLGDPTALSFITKNTDTVSFYLFCKDTYLPPAGI